MCDGETLRLKIDPEIASSLAESLSRTAPWDIGLALALKRKLTAGIAAAVQRGQEAVALFKAWRGSVDLMERKKSLEKKAQLDPEHLCTELTHWSARHGAVKEKAFWVEDAGAIVERFRVEERTNFSSSAWDELTRDLWKSAPRHKARLAREIPAGRLPRFPPPRIRALPKTGAFGLRERGWHRATMNRAARERLQSLLRRIEIADWKKNGHEAEARAQAARDLAQRISEAAAGRTPAGLAEPQLLLKLRQFHGEIAGLAARHLPATALALRELHESLLKLLVEAVESLLGEERLVIANVRSRLRALLLGRTPILLFPWRLALSIANLSTGPPIESRWRSSAASLRC